MHVPFVLIMISFTYEYEHISQFKNSQHFLFLKIFLPNFLFWFKKSPGVLLSHTTPIKPNKQKTNIVILTTLIPFFAFNDNENKISCMFFFFRKITNITVFVQFIVHRENPDQLL